MDDVVYRIEPVQEVRYVDGIKEVYFPTFVSWIAFDGISRPEPCWKTDSLDVR